MKETKRINQIMPPIPEDKLKEITDRQSSQSNPSTSADDDVKEYNYLINGVKKMLTPDETERLWKHELIEAMKYVSPAFVVDEKNKALLPELYAWAWNRVGIYRPCKLDTDKGILFWGPIGTGKTTLLRGLQRYFAKINQAVYAYNNHDIGMEVRSAAEIALRYSNSGLAALSGWTERGIAKNLGIDEIGREEVAKHFGTPCNTVQTVLQLRYEQRFDIITLGTTNFDMSNPVEFEQRYGEYILDRSREMFNLVKLGGTSRRQ